MYFVVGCVNTRCTVSYCLALKSHLRTVPTHWERGEFVEFISLPTCGFTAQFVEHRTGVTEATGSNPVEALIFFRPPPSNCLNWKIEALIFFRLLPSNCLRTVPTNERYFFPGV